MSGWPYLCVEMYWVFTCDLALTKLCNRFTNISGWERSISGVYAVGLKPTYGGSTPSFLVLERKLVPRRCGMVVGSHGFIPRLY